MFKQAAVVTAKVCISATLFYILVSKVGGKTILFNIRLLSPSSFLAAIGLYIISAYLSTLRWKLLIPFQSKTSRLFSIYMIGSFFNTYLPGIVGGDAVKAYYLNKEMHRTQEAAASNSALPSLPIAVASIFMDRYIGFSALLTLGMVAFPFGIRYLEHASVRWPVIWVVPGGAGIFIAASFVFFTFRIGARIKFLFHIYEYLHFYRSKIYILARSFIYSIFVQLLGVLAVYVLAKGLSLSMSFLTLLVFMPIVILISFLPLSISGIGLREGAFVLLFGSIGIPAEKSLALSITWFLSVFVAGIWGLFEYLRFKTMFGGKKKEKPFQIS